MHAPTDSPLLKKLLLNLSDDHLATIDATVEALYPQLKQPQTETGKESLADMNVMVMFGGGKDSAWSLSFTRMVQLRMEELKGETFQLHSVTGRFPNMRDQVMENMDNIFEALEMKEDPRCTLTLLHGRQAEIFDKNSTVPDSLMREHRTDILLNGHLFGGDARHTFCDQCNLKLAASQGIGSVFANADTVITGDSMNELKDYQKWMRKIAKQLDIDPNHMPKNTPFSRAIHLIDAIGQRRIIPSGESREHDSHMSEAERDAMQRLKTQIFPIFEHAHYEMGDHMNFLKNTLHFNFSAREAVNFSETDCGNPLLMAHMHGLRTEKLLGGAYAEGIQNYVEFATGLMRKKNMTQELIDLNVVRYQDTDTIREEAEAYAQKAYELSPGQMTAMVYAPLGSKGKNLAVFLEKEYPGDEILKEASIRALLEKATLMEHVVSANDEKGSVLKQAFLDESLLSPQERTLTRRLEEVTGLSPSQLAVAYHNALVYDPLEHDSEVQGIAGILKETGNEDPHRVVPETSRDVASGR